MAWTGYDFEGQEGATCGKIEISGRPRFRIDPSWGGAGA